MYELKTMLSKLRTSTPEGVYSFKMTKSPSFLELGAPIAKVPSLLPLNMDHLCLSPLSCSCVATV